jgi:hypothetical protein
MVERLLVLAVVTGALTAVIPSGRASLGVTALSVVVFSLFLYADGADGRGSSPGLSFDVVILFGALLGRGQRWIRAPADGRSR